MLEVFRRRRAREARTIEAMVALYCRGNHGSRGTICPGCRSLLDGALARLARCPFGEEKPTCLRCPVHCYGRELREAVKEVMRWSGPRMLRRHPVLAALHFLDGLRRPVRGTDPPPRRS